MILFSLTAGASDTCKDEKNLFKRSRKLFYSGQYLLSSLHFSELSTSSCDPYLAQEALFAYSLGMFELGEIGEALRNLSDFERIPDLKTQSRMRLLRAFISPDLSKSLSEESQIRIKLWSLRSSPSDLVSLARSALLNEKQRTELLEVNDELIRLPRKDPWIAATASLIPGAGQAYVGSFQSAAIAFILNSLFLATTLELARKDLPTAALASGMVFSITYIGNILNAADAAKRYNANTRSPHETRLRSILFPEFSIQSE